MSKDINLLTPKLQQAWIDLRPWYAPIFPDCELIVGCTQRTPVEQLNLFCQGRNEPGEIVTYLDGFVHKSKHNEMPLSKAMDIWTKINGVYVWDKKYVLPFGDFIKEKYNGILRWGGAWQDYYHIEEI